MLRRRFEVEVTIKSPPSASRPVRCSSLPSGTHPAARPPACPSAPGRIHPFAARFRLPLGATSVPWYCLVRLPSTGSEHPFEPWKAIFVGIPSVEPMTEDDDTDRSTGTGRRVKVARLIEEYDLEGLGDQLVEQWTAPKDERESLRSLAELFNRRVLRAALEPAGVHPLESELDAYLSVLTDGDVSTGERVDVEQELERAGIDIDALTSDFVTHQAVHTYLTDYRGVSLPEESVSSADRIERGRGTIDRLEGRLSTVTTSVLEGLRDAGHIRLGNFRVFTRIEVYCDDCDSQMGVGELLTSGGCNCEDVES